MQIENNVEIELPLPTVEPGYKLHPGHRIPFRLKDKTKPHGYSLYTKYLEPVKKKELQLLVPLQDVTIQGILEAGHATLDVQLSFSNLGDENPIECTFEFPLEKNTVVSKLIAQIDDKTIEAKIKEKEEAK